MDLRIHPPAFSLWLIFFLYARLLDLSNARSGLLHRVFSWLNHAMPGSLRGPNRREFLYYSRCVDFVLVCQICHFCHSRNLLSICIYELFIWHTPWTTDNESLHFFPLGSIRTFCFNDMCFISYSESNDEKNK